MNLKQLITPKNEDGSIDHRYIPIAQSIIDLAGERVEAQLRKLYAAKTGVERMQVNVRLSIEHTQKYLELIEYYKSKEGITFLGEEMSPAELESNSTALGRFLLETALEDAYMELKDQKTIEEIAS